MAAIYDENKVTTVGNNELGWKTAAERKPVSCECCKGDNGSQDG